MKNNLKKHKHIGVLTSLGLFLPMLLVFTLFSPKAEALSVISSSLDLGSTGTNVTTLQTFLAQDASIYPRGLVTGYFGPLTQEAVENFQQRYGIQVVGRVGPITLAKINSFISNGGYGNGSATVTSSGPGQAPAITNATSSLSPQYSSGALNSSVVISWQTDRPVTGKVFYGTSPLQMAEVASPTAEPIISNASVVTDDSLSSSKSITLNNLWQTNNTDTYYYVVEAKDANGFVSITWPRTLSSSGVSSQY